MKHSPAFQPRPRRQERRNLEKLWRFPFPFSAINVSAGNQACLCLKITGSHLKHFKTSAPAQTLGRETTVPVSLVSSQYGGCLSKEEMRQLFRRFSSYIAMSAYEVKHNVKGQEFYIALEKGKAVLQYENEGNNTMNMYHTMVPSEYRGKGIAGHLAKAAFDYAVGEDFKMRLTCTYLQKYVKDNPLPEYTSRVV